jgi:hypothetical protein
MPWSGVRVFPGFRLGRVADAGLKRTGSHGYRLPRLRRGSGFRELSAVHVASGFGRMLPATCAAVAGTYLLMSASRCSLVAPLLCQYFLGGDRHSRLVVVEFFRLDESDLGRPAAGVGVAVHAVDPRDCPLDPG